MAIVFIHRGRNRKTDYLGNLIAPTDAVFDYRGRSTITMLRNAWVFSRKSLPSAQVYLVEGALCLWPAFFYKLRHPQTRIIMMIPEPAFNWRVRPWAVNFLLGLVFNFTDYFLPISNLVAEDLRHYSQKPFTIVHQFPELDMPELAAISPDYQTKRMLFVINRPQETGWTKGLDRVLAITQTLAQQQSGWELYLIGAGTENLSGEWSELVRQGVVHLEGYQNPLRYYALCPYLLVPARYDAFPLAVVEACAAGCIPLISPTTGSEEFIRPIYPNLVSDFKSPQNVINELESLASLPAAELNELVAQMRKVAQTFTRERAAQELQDGIIAADKAFSADE